MEKSSQLEGAEKKIPELFNRFRRSCEDAIESVRFEVERLRHAKQMN